MLNDLVKAWACLQRAWEYLQQVTLYHPCQPNSDPWAQGLQICPTLLQTSVREGTSRNSHLAAHGNRANIICSHYVLATLLL
jgi:hypothetical protein